MRFNEADGEEERSGALFGGAEALDGFVGDLAVGIGVVGDIGGFVSGSARESASLIVGDILEEGLFA